MDVAVRQSPHIGPKQAKVLILSPLMSGRKATIWLAESTELVLQYKSILSMKLLAEAQRGQSIEQNDAETAKIYTNFAQIAEQNEHAWSYGKPAGSEEIIRTVSKRNRMICFPHPPAHECIQQCQSLYSM